MKNGIYLLLLLFSTSLTAQDLWKRNFSVMGLGNVWNVEHADIDSDGLEDIIVGTNVHLSWIKNMGNGQFAQQPMIAPLQAFNFNIDDIDLDGNTDIILNNVFFFNDGNGKFESREIEFSQTKVIRGLIDFDSDGDNDIITVESDSEEIHIHLNNGQQEYGTALSFSTDFSNAMVQHLNVVDIDQDSDQDILISKPDGFVILKNENASIVQLNISSSNIGLSSYGDIDGDGDLDLVLANQSASNVQLFLNDDNEDWNFETIIYSYSGFIKNIDIIDIDGDLDLDIIFPRSNNIISWFENINGDFSTINNITPAYTSRIAKMVDLDNDGALDILTYKSGTLANSTIPKVAWHKNEDNNFPNRREITFHFTENASTWPIFSAGDIDNDGDQDLIIKERGIRLAENYGGNSIGMPRVLLENRTHNDMVLKDIDQNGTLDILGIQGDTLLWHLNDGDGNFIDFIPIGTTPYFYILAADAADLDNDGDLDVIGQSFEFQSDDSEIFWFENIDGTNYTKHILYEEAFRANKIEVSDLNNDGNIDIIVTTSNSKNILLLENQGNGQFTYYIKEAAGIPLSFFAIDIDHDGLDDLVYSRFYADGGLINYYKNLGDGNWSSTMYIATFYHSNESEVIMYPIDMNGDGLLDIVYGANRIRLNQFDYQSEAGVILNLGDGNFGDPNHFFKYDYHRHEYSHIIAVDLDGDMAPDPVLHYAARDLNVNYADDEFNDIAWFPSKFDVIPGISVNSIETNCNSNLTIDHTDDYIDLNLNLAGNLVSAGYQVSIEGGTISPDQGTYGETQQFVITPEAGIDSLYLTIVDSVENSVVQHLTIENIADCSAFTTFIDTNIIAIECSPGDLLVNTEDDRITFQFQVNSTLSGTYTLSGEQFTTASGNYNLTNLFEANPGTAGNGDLLLKLHDSNYPDQSIDIIIEDPGNCSIVGTEEVSDDIQILINPNPFIAQVTFDIKDADHVFDFELQINSITGAQVYHQQLSSARTTLDFSTFSPGLYYYQLLGTSGEISKSGLLIKL